MAAVWLHIGNVINFFKVPKGRDRDGLQEKVRATYQKNYGEWLKDVKILTLDEVYFNNDGYMINTASASMLRLLIIVVFALLVSAVFNYINLSFALTGKKSKEIAIRKVFGGTIRTETLNSVRSYMTMVLAACIIGIPIAVYAAGRYLEQFAYRIENCWWIFILAVVLSFTISLLSVLWQTLKAAHTNPATELKKE